MRQTLSRSAIIALLLLVAVPLLSAEELTLKDGHKITGTIVGFEDGMFRVETEFGFALIRKDKVASIGFSAPVPKQGSQEASEQKRQNPATKSAIRYAEKISGPDEIRGNSSLESSSRHSAAAGANGSSSAPKPVAVKPLPPPPPSHPVDEPLPAPIRDHVEGANYINDTFQFAMFKPPGWKIYEGVPRETGYGIVAMGTEDERTILVVDRQVWSGPPDLKNDRVEDRLRETYPEYRKISESRSSLSGYPATKRVFKAVIDQAEWRGVTVHLVRGNTVFGIVGLTSAETLEFEQAVLNKIVNSFHFLAGSPTATGPAPATP